MKNNTSQFVVLTATLVAGLFATGLAASAFAETTIPFRGMYEGYDSEGDDLSGSFVDWGTYSAFDGAVEAHGTYQFVEDSTEEFGGYYTTQYVISDDQGNSLAFESREISWVEYGNGKYGIAQSEWKIVGGEGKFAGAAGEGNERVWFNLEDMSYKGITSGNISLS